jgi:nucleoside-diphosphate-sugar epimerase
MHIVITGGAGFLGLRLARSLLARGTLSLAGAAPAAIRRITLLDRIAPPPDVTADARVQGIVGDLLQGLRDRTALPHDVDAVFHLAAAVSGECEADFDLGMRSNFETTHALLESCRALGHTRGQAPLLVFASSLAVFGQTPWLPLPDVITDSTLPTPQSSYGIQKFIGEQLVADYARKGFVIGRSARLMTVSVRPGRPNGAASGFLSGMLREPLAGQRAVVPVPADLPVALSSPARTIDGLLRAAEATPDEWGPLTALNLPALTTSPRAMAEALERVAGAAATRLLDWRPDERVARVVGSWPARFDSVRARALGLAADPDFESIVRQYVGENPEATPLAAHA